VDTVDVGLHHDRVERLIDPPTRLQDRREERTFAELGDLQFDVTGLCRQQPRPGAVALGDTGLGTFVAVSADPFGRFNLDQFLQHQTHRIPDEIDSLASAERVKQLGQDRL